MSQTNPLIAVNGSFPSPHFDGAVAFDQLKTEHFLPAFDAAVTEALQSIDKIADASEPATFANTVHALEKANYTPYTVLTVYYNLRAADGDDEVQALASTLMPKFAKFESDVRLNKKLFERIRVVYENRSNLSTEEATLTDKFYKDFKRNGAELDEAKSQQLREIDEELSKLSPKFSENVLKETNGWDMLLTDEKDLAGLPESAIARAAKAAADKGKVGWLFTLHYASVISFFCYAENRSLREKLYKAYTSLALKGENSNQENIKQIVTLRHKRAQLLGYKTHAHFQTEERMAETPENVQRFLERLLSFALPAAQKDMEDLKALKKEEEGNDDFQRWDQQFWTTKLRKAKLDFDPDALRPWFPLQQALNGAFEVAKKLYGITFEETQDVPKYQNDVQVFKVFDPQNPEGGKPRYLGLFYADFFPRDTKNAGAWCTRFRPQWKERAADGATNVRPHVSIVCNFSPPTGDDPALLSYGEVNTLFHEFGHALHSLLSDCEFLNLSCTNVYRDFVELPSQVLENWLAEEEVLNLFAKHYKTGEPLPPDMVQKIQDSRRFQAGLLLLRQLRFGLLDLGWHGRDPSDAISQDVEAFEQELLKDSTLLPKIPGTSSSCSFQHIFAGGYSAGYYGYKWAEVLDADAFEYFKEKGLFDQEVATKFRNCILARGGSVHPAQLYRDFRGRDPDPDALLKRDGLLS